MSEKFIIKAEHELLRRIPLVPSHIKMVNGIRKPTSAAFKTKAGEDGLSIDILALTSLEKSIPNNLTHTGDIVIASLPITLGYDCVHDPLPHNLAHALILGDTRPIANLLADFAVLL